MKSYNKIIVLAFAVIVFMFVIVNAIPNFEKDVKCFGFWWQGKCPEICKDKRGHWGD